MATIGILGGMGPQASNRLVELLIEKALDRSEQRLDTDVPEIVLLSVPVPNFVSNKNNMKIAKKMLINRTKILESAHCTVAGIACNTAHLLLPEIQSTTSLLFVSLPHLVADHISKKQFKRVGLLGSPNTLSSTLCDDVINSAVIVRPGKKLAELTEESIHKQLKDMVSVRDKVIFRRAIDRFIDSQQLDAVILGCTELPLIFGKLNDDRIVDTLDVLAEGLLRES